MKFDPKDVTIEKLWMGSGKGNVLRAVHHPTNTTISRNVPPEASLQKASHELAQEIKAAVEKSPLQS